MAIVATPYASAVICGRCGARFEFAPSYDRRFPIADAIAAGWGTALTLEGHLDYACPGCVVGCSVEGSPIAVPDDTPSECSATIWMGKHIAAFENAPQPSDRCLIQMFPNPCFCPAGLLG
jgi:hypothetical protein